LYEAGGELALREICRRKPCPRNRVEEHVEKAVVEIALDKPAFGQVRVANELTRRSLFVSPTGVRSVWLRHDLETFRKRLKALPFVLRVPIVGNMTEVQLQLTRQGTKYYKDDDLNEP
jgi:hypothetical protein